MSWEQYKIAISPDGVEGVAGREEAVWRTWVRAQFHPISLTEDRELGMRVY